MCILCLARVLCVVAFACTVLYARTVRTCTLSRDFPSISVVVLYCTIAYCTRYQYCTVLFKKASGGRVDEIPPRVHIPESRKDCVDE